MNPLKRDARRPRLSKIIETTIKLLSAEFRRAKDAGLQENQRSFGIIWTCVVTFWSTSTWKGKKRRKSLRRSLSRIRVSRRGWIIMRLMARWFKAGNAFELSDGRPRKKEFRLHDGRVNSVCGVMKRARDSRGGWLLKNDKFFFAFAEKYKDCVIAIFSYPINP